MPDSIMISFTTLNRGKPLLVRLAYVYRLKKINDQGKILGFSII